MKMTRTDDIAPQDDQQLVAGYQYLDEKGQHLHTLAGQPLYGTSTVVGILNKPLTWWAAGMAVGVLGWTATQTDSEMRLESATIALDGIKALDPKNYLKLLDKAYKAHNEKKKDAAVGGVDMHAELEKYVQAMIADNDGKPTISKTDDAVGKFSKWAHLNVKQFLFSEKNCYSSKHWLGGIVDAGAIMEDGYTALLDFKSSKEPYYSHLVQVAGYAIQVQENGLMDARGEQELPAMTVDELIVVAFGSDDIKTRATQNIKDFTDAFLGCLSNYKLSQAFGKN